MVKKLIFLLILNLAFLAVSVVTGAEKHTADIWTIRLRDCYLDYHHTSIDAFALACPGVDYTRLWPLPVVQPWPDPTDKPEPWPGWYAGKLAPSNIEGHQYDLTAIPQHAIIPWY